MALDRTEFGGQNRRENMTSTFEFLNASSYLDEFRTLTSDERQEVLEQLLSLGFREQEIDHLFHGTQTLSELDTEQKYMQFLEFRVHKVLLLYVPPFLLVLGTLGNLLSFFILRHKSMSKQSIYIYLCTLAIFDSFVLYIGLLRVWVGEVSGSDFRNQSSFLCKCLVMLGYTCSDISVWLIVAVTVERYIIVSHPFKAPSFCQENRAKRIVAGIIILFSLINFHLLISMDLHAVETKSQDGHSKEYVCGPVPGYERLVSFVWPWVDALLYGFGPFILISILNSIIVLRICQANNSRAKLVNVLTAPNTMTPSDYGNIRMTVMLLTVSFTFLLTTLPMNVSSIMANIWINTSASSDQTKSKGILFATVASLFMYVNHSINFLLYCATGRKFREVVSSCVCSKFRPRHMPLDHSHHLFCSRKLVGRCVRETPCSSNSQESQL